MRDADKEEIWLSHNKQPMDALMDGYRQSVWKATIENGKAIAMFGVSKDNLSSDKGVIWLLGTDDLNRIRIRFARHSKSFIELLLNVCGYLENYVSVKNQESIKWLRMCGAHFEDALPYGVEEALFYHFWFLKENKDV